MGFGTVPGGSKPKPNRPPTYSTGSNQSNCTAPLPKPSTGYGRATRCAPRSLRSLGACVVVLPVPGSRLTSFAVRNRGVSLRSTPRRSRPSSPPGQRPHHTPPQPTPSPSLRSGSVSVRGSLGVAAHHTRVSLRSTLARRSRPPARDSLRSPFARPAALPSIAPPGSRGRRGAWRLRPTLAAAGAAGRTVDA